jgi:hypothetical protein
MSRTYNLRNRTGFGIANPSSQVVNIPPFYSPDHSRGEIVNHPEGIHPGTVADTMLRTYSDVVAARSPSPGRERLPMPSGGPNTDNNGRDANIHLENECSNHSDVESIDVARNPPSEGSETHESNEGLEWSTVRRRRARNRSNAKKMKPLSSEQNRVVKVATQGMTNEQKLAFQCRHEKVRAQRAESVSSRGEGPSRRK